jgi:hypothetical protein
LARAGPENFERSVGMKHPVLRRLVLLLTVAIFWLLYSVIHETGHILALIAFGAWQHGGATLLPVPGQMPHVSGDPSAHLVPWQIAVAALSGPLLPTLLGYVSFGFWSTQLGSRCRSQRLWADVGWSLFTVMLVFPQAALMPLLLTGVAQDRDYSLLTQNVGPSLWVVKTALAALSLINLLILVKLVRHLVLQLRGLRTANKDGAANGSQLIRSETNGASGAAGSRR